MTASLAKAAPACTGAEGFEETRRGHEGRRHNRGRRGNGGRGRESPHP